MIRQGETKCYKTARGAAACQTYSSGEVTERDIQKQRNCHEFDADDVNHGISLILLNYSVVHGRDMQRLPCCTCLQIKTSDGSLWQEAGRVHSTKLKDRILSHYFPDMEIEAHKQGRDVALIYNKQSVLH